MPGNSEGIEDGDGVLGLLSQWAQPGAGLDGLVDGGGGGRKVAQQGPQRRGAGARGRGVGKYRGQWGQGAAQRGVELGQPSGELVGAVGEFGEIAFSGVTVGDGANQFVTDLGVLPGQLGLLESRSGAPLRAHFSVRHLAVGRVTPDTLVTLGIWATRAAISSRSANALPVRMSVGFSTTRNSVMMLSLPKWRSSRR